MKLVIIGSILLMNKYLSVNIGKIIDNKLYVKYD